MVRRFAVLCAVFSPLIAYAACPETDLGTALPVSVAGTTAGQTNAFAGTCGGGGASAPEQTFIWHAPVADSYHIDTFGSALDTVLYVRNDNCNGTELACNDDYLPASILQSQVTLSLTAGQTIVIFVDGFGGQSGLFELHINSTGAAPTSTPTRTSTLTQTRTPTLTATHTPTALATSSATLTPTATPTRTSTTAGTATPTATPTPTFSVGISGQIRYYSNSNAVGATTLLLNGLPNGQTATAGDYFLNVASGMTWQIMPTKVGDTGTSVSSLDAAWVLQAAIGSRTLSPEQRLAADVTGNGSVSSLDSARILQFKLGLITTLPVTEAQHCGSDWVFVPIPTAVPNQQMTMPMITTPSCQMGAISYNPLGGQAASQDFLGIVFGDVTGNWQPPSGGGGGSALSVSAPSLRIQRLRQRRSGGLDLPVSVSSSAPYESLEVELEYDPSRLRPVRVRRLSAARGAILAANLQVPGIVRIALASSRPLDPGDGSPIVVQFETHGHASVTGAIHARRGSVDARAAELLDADD